MDREILFRGKDDNNNWCYGYAIIGKRFKWASILPIDTIDDAPPMFDECEVELDTVGQYTGLTDKNGTKIFEGDIVKVYAERNVHGRKQSVEDRYIPVRAVVEFGQDWYSVGFILNYKNKYNENLCNPKNKEKQKRTFSYYPFGDYSSAVHYVNSKWNYIHEIEVIGNIHDNPELLEEDK